MNKKYVSPVCRLIEVAPQTVICDTMSPFSPNEILSPADGGHGTLGPKI